VQEVDTEAAGADDGSESYRLLVSSHKPGQHRYPSVPGYSAMRYARSLKLRSSHTGRVVRTVSCVRNTGHAISGTFGARALEDSALLSRVVADGFDVVAVWVEDEVTTSILHQWTESAAYGTTCHNTNTTSLEVICSASPNSRGTCIGYAEELAAGVISPQREQTPLVWIEH
jgi:hypothetical protein